MTIFGRPYYEGKRDELNRRLESVEEAQEADARDGIDPPTLIYNTTTRRFDLSPEPSKDAPTTTT